MDKEEAKAKVKSWALDAGAKIQEAAQPNESFQFIFKDPRLTTEVVQPVQYPETILIVAGITISKEHSDRINALDAAARTGLLWKLRFRLIGAGVDFEGIELPLSRIVVSQQIVFDGLTKDAFYQRWNILRRAALITLWTISEEFDEQPNFPTGMLN